jgi:hypothetical protein
MILIELLFASKNIEGQEYPVKIWLPELSLQQLFSLFLAARPRGILRHSESINNDIRTKIHLLW